ncbi:hypothetical protein [Nocardia gipuzkoensis]
MDDSTQRVMAAREAVMELVPSPWNREKFLTALGEWRGRPIDLIPVASALLPGPWSRAAGRRAGCGWNARMST